ncbi:hypothetical protein KIN20_001045 [Parelaphostrongylus tenuis]|uniref:Uncharacterized protein n=1 Tax=Parelaphostrongylus tenuis TaxID=148309 RepID=A0AAD5QCB1_PARTN|nr:hypothetical protein KIN20_001045 [Parelaphostrongylus tenuis]
MLSNRRRLNDIVSACVRSRSLSLWRMLMACMAECAQPQHEVSIEVVRACASMLQGILDFCDSPGLLEDEVRWKLKEIFPTLADVNPWNYSSPTGIDQCVSLVTDITQKQDVTPADDQTDDEMDKVLNKLTQKFSLKQLDEDDVTPMSSAQTRISDDDESTEKITAKQFVDSLIDKIAEWSKFKSTLEVDDAILDFSSGFYNVFSAVQNEAFKSKSKAQLEFLNTDAIYITVYSTLCLALRGKEAVPWMTFRDNVLKSGCIVYASESWLRNVYDNAVDSTFGEIEAALLHVVKDYDGLDHRILTDVERLQQISLGKPQEKPIEERIAARWFIASEWNSIVQILSTFLGIKDRRKARQKIKDGIEYSIKGMQLLAAVALELELADRCGWIFEKLVESSCDVDELRTLAESEDQACVESMREKYNRNIMLVQ